MKTTVLLDQLPDAFTLDDVRDQLVNPNNVHVVLQRLEAAGKIFSLAKRSCVYYKNCHFPYQLKERKNAAIRLLYPEAIVATETVLFHNFWLNKLDIEFELFIKNQHKFNFDNIRLNIKPVKWFGIMKEFNCLHNPTKAAFKTQGFVSLKPEVALIDYYLSGNDLTRLTLPESYRERIETMASLLITRQANTFVQLIEPYYYQD